MQFFEGTEVDEFEQQTIDNITAEDAKAKQERKTLEVELERIQVAREKFETFAMRTGTQLVSDILENKDKPGTNPNTNTFTPDAGSRTRLRIWSR